MGVGISDIDYDLAGVPSIPLLRVCPSASDEAWSEERVYTCPMAEMKMPWVGDALELYSLTTGETGVALRDLVDIPSNAALESLSVLSRASAASRAKARKDMKK